MSVSIRACRCGEYPINGRKRKAMENSEGNQVLGSVSSEEETSFSHTPFWAICLDDLVSFLLKPEQDLFKAQSIDLTAAKRVRENNPRRYDSGFPWKWEGQLGDLCLICNILFHKQNVFMYYLCN